MRLRKDPAEREDTMKLRAWAEYISPKDVSKKNVIRMLKKYNVILGMAFPQGSMNKDYAKMIGEYEQAGVHVMLWPLLSDKSGYWPCERNAREFTEYIDQILDWADTGKFGFPWIAADIETPIYQMDNIKKAGGAEKIKIFAESIVENRDRGRFYDSAAEYNRLVERLHARGIKVLAAASNFVAEDIIKGTTGIQDAMETPISTVNWDVVSFMLYTSMFAGYLKPFVTPRDARWYLYSIMSDMKGLMWERAGISIGCTYTGKLEDEPFYATPAELLPDMQAAKAALIDDISIYNLEGILRSPQPEAWFDALVSCEAAVPERSVKTDAARFAMQVISKLI
jgi:hypothetical protein